MYAGVSAPYRIGGRTTTRSDRIPARDPDEWPVRRIGSDERGVRLRPERPGRCPRPERGGRWAATRSGGGTPRSCQVYPRSFADSDGDGVGDLAGITGRLEHLAGLGVEALWLTPFQRSPQADHGYDVSDYVDVDPLFGYAGLDFERAARARPLRSGCGVLADVVPNHCSPASTRCSQAALAAGPGCIDARARFHFAPGRGP